MSLEKNVNRYLWAEEKMFSAFRNQNYEQAILWANIAAYCSWNGHIGHYCSREIENCLIAIGKNLKVVSAEGVEGFSIRGEGRHWLHVVTIAFGVGGHTRLLERLIETQLDSNDIHSVIALDQGAFTFPESLKAVVRRSGGEVRILPDSCDFVQRATILRTFSREWADIVVLYSHPNDPIPTVAFAEETGPPVLLYNHADHVFWLGSRIADIVLELRDVGKHLTLSRRGVRDSVVLPIPLRLSSKVLSRSECKQRLGIPDDSVLLVSIATSYKFQPYAELNLPHAVSGAIKYRKDTYFIAVGPSADEGIWKDAAEVTEGRVRAVGVQKDIQLYYGAADIFLEPFPFGSFISCMDAVLAGAPLLRSPIPPLPIMNMDKYDGMNENPINIREYQQLLSSLVDDPDRRVNMAVLQRADLVSRHVGVEWNDSFNSVLRKIPTQHHVLPEDFSALTGSVGEEDRVWAKIQSRHSFTSHGAHVLRDALRRNYKYLKKRSVLSGLVKAFRLKEFNFSWSELQELAIDIALLILPGRIFGWFARGYAKKIG